MIVIRGGRVLTPTGWEESDVLVEDSEVSGVGQVTVADNVHVIDATGCLVGPGFVDLHVHFREPGQTWKEDIESGSRAAAVGGFTAAVMMPNTEPAIDDAAAVRKLSVRRGLVELGVSAALTVDRRGAELTDLEALYRAGVRLFSDDGDCLEDPGLLKEAMTRLAALSGAVLSQHAEDSSMTSSGHMHHGEMSASLGVEGLPSEAESAIVERDLAMVAETGVLYHCQHVSAAATVDLIRDAKARGLPVTAEVAPHHLTFSHDSLEGLDTHLKMYPPLRTEDDRDALRAGLKDRTIDAVATDHAPHSEEEKAVPFADAPRGVIGLETAASAVYEIYEDPNILFEVLSTAPARVGGFVSHGRPVEVRAPANLVVFDPDSIWMPESFQSKSSNSPYRGRKMKGKVIATIYEGRVTHEVAHR